MEFRLTHHGDTILSNGNCGFNIGYNSPLNVSMASFLYDINFGRGDICDNLIFNNSNNSDIDNMWIEGLLEDRDSFRLSKEELNEVFSYLEFGPGSNNPDQYYSFYLKEGKLGLIYKDILNHSKEPLFLNSVPENKDFFGRYSEFLYDKIPVMSHRSGIIAQRMGLCPRFTS